MDISVVLFYVLALAILLCAYKTITHPNPIFSALYLALSMIGLAGVFFSLQAYFIAGVQLIVYAGAVMVLFVMVLMLFDLRQEIRAFSKGAASGFLKIASAGLLCGLIIGAALKSRYLLLDSEAPAVVPSTESTKELATLLFTKYLFAFEALGVLLLVVAIGVVAVSRSKGGTHAKS